MKKLEGKKVRTDDLVKKTTYKTDKNSRKFRIINVHLKIPNTHNLVKKSDFTPSVTEIKK